MRDDKYITEKDRIRSYQLHLLATFLWSDDLSIDKTDSFVMSPAYFDDDLKEIVKRVNEETNGDKYYGFLNVELENIYPVQWLAISVVTPISFNFAAKYYAKLSNYRILEDLKK